MTARNAIDLLPRGPRRVLATVGVCIYCGSTDKLSDEHAIPFALGGTDVLEDASCAACAAETSAVELRITRSPALWPLRRALNLPSRRPKKQPDGFRAREVRGDTKTDVTIPVQRYPLAVPFFVFGVPTYRRGEVAPEVTIGQLSLWLPKPLSNSVALEMDMHLDANDIARMIAKIGLGYAVAAVGLDSFEAVFVRDLILGRTQQGNVHVGTVQGGRKFASNRLHASEVTRTEGLVTAFVQLFRPPHAHQPTPVYEIVVGRAAPTVVATPSAPS